MRIWDKLSAAWFTWVCPPMPLNDEEHRALYEPQRPSTDSSRDRALRGKARRRARRTT